MKLRIAPITVKQARPFCERVHRRLKHVQGAMWAVSVVDWAGVVGVALVGFAPGQWNQDEHGSSLKASGWVQKGETAGGEHDRASRPRNKAVDANPKNRWFAPWSLRAKVEP